MSPAHIHHGAHQRGVHVELTPAAVPALFGMPASQLTEQSVELSAVDSALRFLPEQLAHAPAERRALVVKHAIAQALRQRDGVVEQPAMARAVSQLQKGADVQRVAAEVGYSRRRLHSLIKDHCGLSPKQLQRLARFERSHRLAQRLDLKLSTVAARAGFTDQAHMTREWNQLAGCTPGQWRRGQF